MSTRSANNRNVRQRKLNTKQPLRVIRESDLDDIADHETQQSIPQVETGVEKGEEVEYHLQAIIKGSHQSYIPTPDAVKARGVKYDELYAKSFSQPATYIRFSSTVEDTIGTPYCMNEDDAKFLEQLNDGKDVNGQPLKDKSAQCSEDTFEEVMDFFEETSQRIQPFANVDSAPVLTLDEMLQNKQEDLSGGAEKFLKPLYQYWVSKKGSRPLMPAIKVKVLDTTSEADDADPYVCFRRREVRQTRKTRGRDAQVVEKLKKLRIELEMARNLVASVREREHLNGQNLKLSRTVFEQRKSLKEVKVAKNIVGEKGEDEELLVNQKPVVKPKRPEGSGQRPTIRLRSIGERSAPENDFPGGLLADVQADADSFVQQAIESRKEQHRRWNQQWSDETWGPLTPPPDAADQPPRWAALPNEAAGYPTPPPSLPSRSSQDRDGDVEMEDRKPPLDLDTVAGAEPQFTFFVPPPHSIEHYFGENQPFEMVTQESKPVARLRWGRGGRLHLEARRPKRVGRISQGVVSDSDSDDEEPEYFRVSDSKSFDYRCAMNSRARPEGQRPSGDQTAIVAAQQAQQQQQAAAVAVHQQQQVTAGSAG
ncbi:Enhancer of polycomb 1 [Lecanosticta acicola]|uniref:Enhancer of polycomb-like protein n=1 Tax=Lecanosticta acicola TaxID=111012 RepID=A0AAI8Z1L8_9PEZI|nr:Enhancer of polycomb 1 [Lecanosticta acicola]